MQGLSSARLLAGRRWWLLLALPLVLLPLAFVHRNDDPENAPADPDELAPPTLLVATVSPQPWPKVVRVHGSLVGDELAVVGTRVAGLVDEVKVDVGTPVAKGQVLAVLDAREYELRVRLAEATLEQQRARLGLRPGDPEDKVDRTKTPLVRQERTLLDIARVKLTRARRLAQDQAVTAEGVEDAQNAVDVAEARYQSALNGADEQIAQLAINHAELALARQAEADAVIRAPFAGIVQERQAAPGVYLQRGEAVLTLVRTDPLRYHATVSEREAMQVEVGQQVSIELEGQETHLTAKVCRISPSLNLASRSLLVEADVPNPGSKLRGGLFAEARILIDPSATTLAVPAAAVTEFAGVEKVWVVKDGVASEHPVRTGRRDTKAVEILDGLAPGDQVALDARQARPGRVAAVSRPMTIGGAD
jgi:RND family efflux transporter MFP subunit